MKNQFKRLSAQLLAIVMLLSLLPMQAFAAGSDADGPSEGKALKL